MSLPSPPFSDRQAQFSRDKIQTGDTFHNQQSMQPDKESWASSIWVQWNRWIHTLINPFFAGGAITLSNTHFLSLPTANLQEFAAGSDKRTKFYRCKKNLLFLTRISYLKSAMNSVGFVRPIVNERRLIFG